MLAILTNDELITLLRSLCLRRILRWLTTRRCTGINRMWMTENTYNIFTGIYNTTRQTSNRVSRFTKTFNIAIHYWNLQNYIVFTVTCRYSNSRDRRRTCMRWNRCCTNKWFTWQNRRPSIRLKNIIWLKRKHIPFRSTYNHFFFQKFVD